MSSSCSDHECPHGFNCYLKLTLYLVQKLEKSAGLSLDTASEKNWNWFPTRTITACWVSHADTTSHQVARSRLYSQSGLIKLASVGYWSVIRYCVRSHWAIIGNAFKHLIGCID